MLLFVSPNSGGTLLPLVRGLPDDARAVFFALCFSTGLYCESRICDLDLERKINWEDGGCSSVANQLTQTQIQIPRQCRRKRETGQAKHIDRELPQEQPDTSAVFTFTLADCVQYLVAGRIVLETGLNPQKAAGCNLTGWCCSLFQERRCRQNLLVWEVFNVGVGRWPHALPARLHRHGSL